MLYRIEPPESSSKKNSSWWLCKCSCDNHTLIPVRTDRLTSGSKTSCGCDSKVGRKVDLINNGEKFSKWKVIEYKGVINTHTSYLCECECGTKQIITGSALKHGDTRSCNNCASKHKLDITGKRFGKLVAIEPTEKRKGSFVVWKCQCDCGNMCEVSLGHLRAGNTKSCGCVGQSYQEYKITQMLNKLNLSFISQKSFQDCLLKSGRKGRFDFFINNQYIIEFDGSQHFSWKGNNTWNNKDKFKTTRENDLVKNKYCFEHNIPLIRIPYNIKYTIDDLKLETTRFLLTPENESQYYERLNA